MKNKVEKFEIGNLLDANTFIKKIVEDLASGKSLVIKNDPHSDLILVDSFKWRRNHGEIRTAL